MIKIEKRTLPNLFRDINFVVSGLSKDKRETRLYSKNVKIENERMISTDGHQLRIAHEVPFENGYYEIPKKNKSEIILVKSNEDIMYPDYDNIINTDNHSIFVGGFCQDRTNIALTGLIRSMPEKLTIDIEKAISVIKDIDDTYEIYISAEIGAPIYFNNHTKSAWLMPCEI